MIGSRFANYLVQEKLGEGGMGVVYKGVDLNLDRSVAIKTLPPQLARDQELVGRFRAEAKALANLNHVNIATVYSYLEVNGLHLMVLEYVAGETMEAILRRKHRIGCDEAIRLTKQALLGLAFAHRRGIVHRDIKPSNIMLTPDGIVKVMDFGIAKVLGSERLTRTGGQVGTLAYMSPEQIRSDAIDARSDIYSLSVTLYEMLTGNLPFTGKNEFELMSAHLNAAPPRLNRYCQDISAALESVVLKGLEKKPAARYANAEQFGAALEQASRRPIPVPKPTPPPKPMAAAPAVNKPVMPRPVSPPPPQAVRPATPNNLLQSTTGRRRARNRFYSFLCLVFGIAVLFSLFFGGLYKESIPMLLACAVLLYFLPVLIAAILLKRNGATVVRLNTLRGWTGIGWIQAMKEALAQDE